MRLRLAALYGNVRAGARLALFMRVRPFDYHASPADYAGLVAFNFGVWVAMALVRAGLVGDFDGGAIAAYLAAVPIVLAAAYAVAAIYGMPERTMLIATALTASDATFELIGFVVPEAAALAIASPWTPRWAGVLLLAWAWLISVRAVMVCAGTRRPQALYGALAVTLMIAVGYFLLPRTDVWLAPEEASEPPALATERVFHEQGRLIERALAAVSPGTPGLQETYFVGFAPDASSDVFLKEMRFAWRLFDERFGTAGRSIALAASHDALDELPIASVTNLGRALARTGEAMNADEDLLVLFITAHGGRDHRLSAVQPPLELAALTPIALARMLQEAGIRWRVIVVSACYAGGFIEPLRDENTVVITAAAQDRTSFGCEPGREFTYFGDAYFRDALARTKSFTRAFELARASIARQEAGEKLEPSLPQMWVGRAIGERLERLEKAADGQRKE
jgi:hypothetical protein